MNEKPGGAPNPLAQNPGVAPGPQTAGPAQPATPVAQPSQPRATQATPVAQNPVTPGPAPVAPNPGALSGVVATPTAPVAEENPKGSIVEPKKKSKTGLIVFLVLLFALLIGGAVAAILILNPFGNKQSSVPAAMAKLFSNDRPQNITTSGNVQLTSTGESDSMFKSLAFNFSSTINTKTAENVSNFSVAMEFYGDYDFGFGADEIGTSEGDYYFKVRDFNYSAPDYESDSLYTTEGDTTSLLDDYDYDDLIVSPSYDNSIGSALSVLGILEDKWIRVSADLIKEVWDPSSISMDNTTQCLIDGAGKLGEYGSEFSEMYSNHQFITYSNSNLGVAKKKYELFKIDFDANTLADFINEMSNSGFINELRACMGSTAIASETKVTGDDLSEMLAVLPDIYVEIDNNNNFSRTYLTKTINDMKLEADLEFSYPDRVVVEEPDDYTDLLTLLSLSDQSILNQSSSLFEQNITIFEQ